MHPIIHADQPTEPWRPDVLTRMLVSAEMGAHQMCQFEQWSAPGAGAPTHHHAVEEVVTILEGQADFWVDGETIALAAGQSLIVPAGHPHGFRNSGTSTLHTLATLAAPVFEAAYEDARETPRRWTPRK
ncbi:MAG: cupin domain-containing protein [Chloroflexi bacterium]|nr:cupin domain-containing protein [Chloroflexota bacterium]